MNLRKIGRELAAVPLGLAKLTLDGFHYVGCATNSPCKDEDSGVCPVGGLKDIMYVEHLAQCLK